MTSQYGAYALRAGLAGLYARMRMHNGFVNASHCYVIRTLHVLFKKRTHEYFNCINLCCQFPYHQV